MGEVYHARDTKLKRDVALKVLPEAFARDPGRMTRFQREAEVLASLNHPNIAHIYGVEDRALVMELVEGESPKGPMPFEDAWKIAMQIADALEYAHERGVIHRDLKPANVKVTPDGVVKLLDFGLAKAFSQTPEYAAADPENSPTLTLGATVAGTVLGTAAYMAPEQAKGKRVDKRADIWSWGVLLYELLTGERLFKGEDGVDTLAQVLTKEPDLSKVPGRVRRLLEDCLRKDPKVRLRDIGDAKRLVQEPSPVAAPSHSRFAWVAAALLALVGAGLGFGLWRATRPVERTLIQLSAELGPDASVALGTGGSVALSRDGTLLALTVRGADGQTRLATRRIDEGQLNVLAGTEGAQGPFFSPNGRWIGFSVPGALKKISAQGGAAIPLWNGYSFSGNWGDDGNIIAALGITGRLSRIPEAGGTARPVTEINLGENAAHRFPQVLPGSQAVLFSNWNLAADSDESDIDVITLKTGKRKTVHHGGSFARYLPSGHLVFIQQNTLFAAPFDLNGLALAGEPQPVLHGLRNGYDLGGNFDFSQNGTFIYLSGRGNLQRSIFLLNSAGSLEPLQPTPGDYTVPRFSPDGKHLAWWANDGQGHTDIWVRDLEHDRTQRLTAPGRNGWPVWMPDSNAIVFEVGRPTGTSICWMRIDGSGEPQVLVDVQGLARPSAVSPDGKWLALLGRGQAGGVSIVMAPFEGDANHPTLGKITTFVTSSSPNIFPKFSPDGRWIAYTSGDPGNRGTIVRAVPGPGRPWQIDNTGVFPAWSSTGHELFYVSGGRIMVTSYTSSGNSFEWAKPRPWSEKHVLAPGSPPYSTFDIAPDGKRAAVVLYSDGSAEEKPITHVNVLLNFFDYLRQKVPQSK